MHKLTQYKVKCECRNSAVTGLKQLIDSSDEVRMVCEWLQWNCETCFTMEQMHHCGQRLLIGINEPWLRL